MFIPTPTFFYRKITRRLVPKVGDWSGRARAAHHGVSGPGFNDDGLDTHAGQPALRCLRDVHVRGPCSGVCLKKHSAGLAAGTDKSSRLSRHETGSRNQQHYSQACTRLCRWLSHATSQFSGSVGGRLCLLSFLTGHLSNNSCLNNI